MAMLAEPRQRKRYNLVPKGKALFEDGDRYGTKMLEKMGWSKGKGLGRHENGQQEFIRVRYKNDANGLGFEDRDDQWTEHEKHFNGILENLNGGESNTNSGSDNGDVTVVPTVGLGFQPKNSSKLKDKFSGQSLEEKSKNSKARVHYKKFTKGKDMAQYSEKDLANIFGKKATPDDVNIYTQFQSFGVISRDEQEEEREESVKKTPLEIGTHIINTGVSVSDYFKQKMAALKQKKVEADGNEVKEAENDQEEEGSVKEKNSKNRSAEVDDAEEAPRKKKKSKKQPKSSEENGTPDYENDDQLCTSLTQEDISSKKKKSKKKAEDSVKAEASEPPTETELNDLKVQECTSSKKKKNKKQVISEEDNITPLQVDEVELAEAAAFIKPTEKVDDSVLLENVSSKKKKRKNKDVFSEESGCVDPTATHELTNSTAEENISSKKKKKVKNQLISEEDGALPNLELTESNATDIQKVLGKKKKSKKEPVIVIDSDNEEDLKTKECAEKKSKQFLVNDETEELNETKSGLLEKTTDEIPSKKKKGKKRSAEELESTESTTEIIAIPKKKKKSKKQTPEDSPSVQEPIKNKKTTAAREHETTSEAALGENPKKINKKSAQTIPTPVIKKFRNIEMHQFIDSNVSQICGYGLSEDLQLDIKSIKGDEERIMRLWSGTLDKYEHKTPRHKIYNLYMTKVRKAKSGRTKIPSMKVKCLKRKNIFECL